MEFLSWLETSSVGEWARMTTWVYPWVNSLHSVGMGFLAGIVAMLAIRVLGFGSFAVAPLEKFLLVVRIAFIVNLTTGLIMFVMDPDRFFFSPTFRVKIILVAAGIITGWLLSRHTFGDGAAWSGEGKAPQATKLIAGLSLACWAGAIVAGRMTAYLP